MATLVRADKVIINLDNVAAVRRFNGSLTIYFNTLGPNDNQAYMDFHDTEAERIYTLLCGLCQFEV